MRSHYRPPRRALLVLLPALWAVPGAALLAQEISLGGFIPLVGIGLTDEFKNGDTDATFFLADP